MPLRIIVIDDAPAIVQLYEELLTDEGYSVVATFAGPPTDPDEVGQHHPDLIIMDWFFGGEVTGLQTLEMLKAHPPTAAIPIIVCTAAGPTLLEAQGILIQRGVRLLHKPFAIDDLLTMIQQVVVPQPVFV